MRSLIRYPRTIALITVVIVVFSAAWLYWNRVSTSDLSIWAPAESLAFAEVDNLEDVVNGIPATDGWKALAPLFDAPHSLSPGRWLVRAARWTGIGSSDALLFARSQVAFVLQSAQATPNGSTIVVKPLLTIIVETHTSQRRMRTSVEHHLEELAQANFGKIALVRKQMNGVDLEEWQSEDGSRSIVAAFVNTTVVIGNDETSVLRSIEASNGIRPSLKNQPEFAEVTRTINSGSASLFGFVSGAGVRSFLQAYVLDAESRAGNSTDSLTRARLFSDTFGGLVQYAGWTSRFASGAVEVVVRSSSDRLREYAVS